MAKRPKDKPKLSPQALTFLVVIALIASVIIVLRFQVHSTVEIVDEEGNIVGEAYYSSYGKYKMDVEKIAKKVAKAKSETPSEKPLISIIPPAPVCGNEKPELGEQCDQGSANSNAPNAACRTDCKNRRCGDDIIDSASAFGEICDDGNTVNSDGCGATCKCQDNDGGDYPSIRGGVILPQYLLFTDFCSGNTLHEQVCALNSNDDSGNQQHILIPHSCQNGCSPDPGIGAKCN